MRKKTALFLVTCVLLATLTGCGTAAEKSVYGTVNDTQGTAAPAGPANPDEAAQIDGIPMDEDAAVITDTVVDVFNEPDIKSERITQAVYNQPISILEEKGGWVRAVTADGNRGWIRSRFIDRDVSSIYGGGFTHKIVVTSKEKSIYDNASGGITLKDVVMGTELYAFNDSGNAYEVYLPGHATGWIRGSGIIHVALEDGIPSTTKEDFVSTALKLKGTSYLMNGVSSMGIDSSGLTYVCARINGVDLPRFVDGQLLSGSEVTLEEAREGDLVFLTGDGDKSTVKNVGICTGAGMFIYADSSAGYVTFGNLNSPEIVEKIFMVKRIFRS